MADIFSICVCMEVSSGCFHLERFFFFWVKNVKVVFCFNFFPQHITDINLLSPGF